MDDFVVERSKPKQIFGLIVAAFFLLVSCISLAIGIIGLFQSDTGHQESALWGTFVSLFLTIVLFFSTRYYVQMIRTKRKVVVLTALGFYDYSTAVSTNDVLVTWRNVEEIGMTASGRNTYVSVRLRDPEQVLGSLSWGRRTLNSMLSHMGYGHINIMLNSALNCTDAVLLDQMLRYKNAASATLSAARQVRAGNSPISRA